MHLSNSYILSLITGIIACLLLYLNNRFTNSDTQLTYLDYSKTFIVVAVIVLVALNLGYVSKSKGSRSSGGGLTQEVFNIGNPGF